MSSPNSSRSSSGRIFHEPNSHDLHNDTEILADIETSQSISTSDPTTDNNRQYYHVAYKFYIIPIISLNYRESFKKLISSVGSLLSKILLLLQRYLLKAIMSLLVWYNSYMLIKSIVSYFYFVLTLAFGSSSLFMDFTTYLLGDSQVLLDYLNEYNFRVDNIAPQTLKEKLKVALFTFLVRNMDITCATMQTDEGDNISNCCFNKENFFFKMSSVTEKWIGSAEVVSLARIKATTVGFILFFSTGFITISGFIGVYQTEQICNSLKKLAQFRDCLKLMWKSLINPIV